MLNMKKLSIFIGIIATIGLMIAFPWSFGLVVLLAAFIFLDIVPFQ